MVATLSVFVSKLLPYFFLWNNVLIHLCDCCFDDTFLLCYNLGAGTANCRGSPMAIALIGGMLRRSCTERKWKAIAEKMEHKHLYLSTRLATGAMSTQLLMPPLNSGMPWHQHILSVISPLLY